jgi:hypothetical protein
MDIKTGIVKIALKEETSFLDKIKILAEGEIRKGIINKKKAETDNRHPEQHLEKDLRRLLKGKYS